MQCRCNYITICLYLTTLMTHFFNTILSQSAHFVMKYLENLSNPDQLSESLCWFEDACMCGGLLCTNIVSTLRWIAALYCWTKVCNNNPMGSGGVGGWLADVSQVVDNCTQWCLSPSPLCVGMIVDSCWLFNRIQTRFRNLILLTPCQEQHARLTDLLTSIWGSLSFVLFLFVSMQDLLLEVKKLRSRVDELETEKSQYERKLRATKVLCQICYNLYRSTFLKTW